MGLIFEVEARVLGLSTLKIRHAPFSFVAEGRERAQENRRERVFQCQMSNADETASTQA